MMDIVEYDCGSSYKDNIGDFFIHVFADFVMSVKKKKR